MKNTSPHINIEKIAKKYSGFSLQDISISANKGEYFVLLGHSGSGKSMLFEILAGLRKPDAGKITLAGKDITNKKINQRDVGIVFQDYAIFPHKTVAENIAFPIQKKKTKKEIKKLVEKLANELNISHLLRKYPNALSGGEIQRCVLARTLAAKPSLLLLDEPLSALDAELKTEIRELLKKINRQGYTIIHITHDYREAISLADKIAILNDGKIIQQGTASEIFSNPKSKFTAAFAGITNFYDAKILGKQEGQTKKVIITNGIELWITTTSQSAYGYAMIACEDIILSLKKQESSSRNNLKGKVIGLCSVVNGVEIKVDAGIVITALITEKSTRNLALEEGKTIWLAFKASATKFIEVGKIK